MTRPVLAALSLFLCTCSSTPPASTCRGDADCSGGRCLANTCFPKACGGQQCGLAQVCIADACVDELCANKTCEAGATCLKGDCLPTRCGAMVCADGKVCVDDMCIDASCYGVVCPGGQTCSAGVCTSPTTCGGVTCTGTTVCDTAVMQCVEPSCVGVRCDAGTCVAGACPDPNQCGAVVCTGGQVCDAPITTCVEPTCLGVRCDGGVCMGGQCLTACTPSSQCPDGRTCGGDFECQSHLCKAGICTTCDAVSNTCPNGGLCQAGICRSDVLGPCNSVLDCKPQQSLVCEDRVCRYGADAGCTLDEQCIRALRCENLVCQRPRCILANVGTQNVPGQEATFSAQATHTSAQGEVYVTHGQWGNTYTSKDFRRYRVTPDGGVVEQVPTMAPLLAFPSNSPIAQGHSDTPGSAQGTFAPAPVQSFWWYPGGGAFDGVEAVEIQFVGFDNDVSGNFSNGGRFAKCGNSFWFIANALGGTKVMLGYTTPQPVGSGTTKQTLTQHTVRRDTWPFTHLYDINCTANAVYVIGSDGSSFKMGRLSTTNLALVESWTVPGAFMGNNSIGDSSLAVVDDHLQFIVPYSGSAMQVLDAGTLKLSPLPSFSSGYFTAHAAGPDVIVVYDSNGAPANNGRVRRFARRQMNGQTPALDLACIYQ